MGISEQNFIVIFAVVSFLTHVAALFTFFIWALSVSAAREGWLRFVDKFAEELSEPVKREHMYVCERCGGDAPELFITFPCDPFSHLGGEEESTGVAVCEKCLGEINLLDREKYGD